VTDPKQYRDLRRTEGSSSPAGRLPFGEAKSLRLRRIDPGGALSAPGDPPAPRSGAGAFVLATVPARRGSGRLQALIAALLSFILLGSLAALAVIGSGGLPGAPVVPPGVQLEQEVVRDSPVEALPEPAGGVAGAPGQAGPSGQGSAEAPSTTPSVVDETEPPVRVIPAEGGDDGQGEEDQGGGGQGGGGGGQGGGGGGQGGGGGSDDDDDAGGKGDTADEGEPPGGGGLVGGTPDGSGDDGGKDEVKAKGKGPKATGKGHEKAKGKGHQKAKGKGHIHDGDGSVDQVAEPGKGKGKGKDKGATGQPAEAPPAGGPPAEGKGKGNGKGSGG
jgi:hypothetical protein